MVLRMRPILTAILLSLLSLLVGSALARSKYPTPSDGKNESRIPQASTENNQQHPGADQRGTEQSPVIVKIIGAEPKTQNTASDNPGDGQKKPSADWWSICVAGGTLVVLVLQLAAFICQARRLGQTIHVMKDTAERQLRAYVSLKEFGASPMVDIQTNALIAWELRLTWQNTGATPTRDMLSHVSVRFEPDEIPDDFRFPDLWIIGRKQVYVPVHLAPNGVFIDSISQFSLAQLQEVKSGQKTLYVYGWADYSDVFSDTRRRRTEFCARVVFPGEPAYISVANIAFELHWKHNGADDECMRKPITSVKREKIPDLPAQSSQKNNNTT